MIEKLRVRNFRCLRDVEVPLGPLNFLIGPNNTGKSSFLEAIEIMSRCTRVESVGSAFLELGHRLERSLTQPGEGRVLKYDADMCWTASPAPGRRAHYELALRPNPNASRDYERVFIQRECIQLADGQGNALGSFTRLGTGESAGKEVYPDGETEHVHSLGGHATIAYSMEKRGDERFAPLAAALRSTPKYSLVPQRVAQPCQLVEQAELSSDGFGLASCLDLLHQTDPDRFARIEDALRLFVPGVQMVRFPAAGPGQKTILFHEKSGAKVYASEASDGLLLFLAHLTIAYAHGDVGVVLIEEPETGVHPRRLRDIVHLLRAISRGELGLPPVQVVATSHSPYLLNWCSKEEVTLFLRDDAGEVRTTPLTDIPDIDERIEDFASLGEFIYTVGEQACASRS